MSYATYAQELRENKPVQFRPRGNSMFPKIESGQLVHVQPFDHNTLKEGDIVFCKVKGKYYVHLVSAIQGDRIQISNNKGHINGWIGHNGIFGKVMKISN